MTKTNLEMTVQNAAAEFAATIIEAVKNASLQELMVLQAAPVQKRKLPKAKPKASRPKPAAKTVAPRAKRMTAMEKGKLFDSILDYLKTNPASACKAIAASLEVPSRKMGFYLKELKTTGKVISEGNKAAMKYSLPSAQTSSSPS